MKSEQNNGEVQNIQIKNDEEFKTVPGPFDNKKEEAVKKDSKEKKESTEEKKVTISTSTSTEKK